MSAPMSPEFPPAILAYIAGIKPTMKAMIFDAVWLGISLPLLIALFYSSTKVIRRSSIFYFNVFSVCLGITIGFLNVIILTDGMLNPFQGLNRPQVLVFTYLTTSSNLFIDSILLFRVFVVFPIRYTSRRRACFIFGPLLLFKIARLTNLIVFVVHFAHVQQNVGLTSSAQYQPLSRQLIEPSIEWALQLADNGMCSALFLWKLHQARSLSLRIRSGSNGKNSYYQALGTLFWIAASNFIFPSIFNIAIYMLFYLDPNPNDYLMVLVANVYVQIIGVLFATIWRATNDGESFDSTTHSVKLTSLKPMQFAGRGARSGNDSSIQASGVSVPDVISDKQSWGSRPDDLNGTVSTIVEIHAEAV